MSGANNENNNLENLDDIDFDALLDDFLNNEISTMERFEPKPKKDSKTNSSSQHESTDQNNQPISENSTDTQSADYETTNLTDAFSLPSGNIYDPAASLDELGAAEKELMKAYLNFLESVYTVANLANVKSPSFKLESMMMIPNYRPTVGKILSEDVLKGWDVLLNIHFEELKDLDMKSSDDEFLNYAEKLTNPNLQFAIVSYVEILIELEACELSYEEKRLKVRKRKIEKEFFEEQKRKNERKQRFIDAVAAKHFPIDAERLITNYLKTATKDPKGAFDALTENPAIYAPIQNDKIKPRLFGLIKKSPKDGIRMNKKIGKFLKNLKA